MTDRELMQQALEALTAYDGTNGASQRKRVLAALRERLAEQDINQMHLLRRAWDALDTFKQAYPENWHDEDEQVLKDLMRADLRLSGVQLKWVGLTDEDEIPWDGVDAKSFARAIEAKLKEKNNG